MRVLLDFLVNMQKFNGCSFTLMFSLVGYSINLVLKTFFWATIVFVSLCCIVVFWKVYGLCKSRYSREKVVLDHFQDFSTWRLFWLICAHDFSIVLVWLVLERIKCFPIYLGNVIFNRVLIVKFSGYMCWWWWSL